MIAQEEFWKTVCVNIDKLLLYWTTGRFTLIDKELKAHFKISRAKMEYERFDGVVEMLFCGREKMQVEGEMDTSHCSFPWKQIFVQNAETFYPAS